MLLAKAVLLRPINSADEDVHTPQCRRASTGCKRQKTYTPEIYNWEDLKDSFKHGFPIYSHTGMSEPASTTLGVVENFHLCPFHLLVSGHNHLRYPLSIVDDKRFLGQIDENNTYFASVVGVDCSRCVQDGDPFLDGKSATGPHLCLITFRKGDEKSRWHKAPLQGCQCDRLIEIGTQVHSCRLLSLVCWQLMMGAVDDSDVHVFLKS